MIVAAFSPTAIAVAYVFYVSAVNEGRRKKKETHGMDIRRRDRQIRNLEVLDSVDVERRVDDAVLVAGLHGARPELRKIPVSQPIAKLRKREREE
jgi:hypothetical protein